MERPQRLGGTKLETLNVVTDRIIGSAIEVHRILGPGLLESIYDTALCIELDDRGVKYARQVRIPALYKGRSLGHYPCRPPVFHPARAARTAAAAALGAMRLFNYRE